MDRLREGALDARKFLANIGKQRVCPGEGACVGESFQFAQRSGERFSSPTETRLVKLRITICYLAIDFRLRRAFTGPPLRRRDAATPRGLAPPKAAPKYLSRAHSVTQEPNVGFPTILTRESLPQRYILCIESASKGPKWISSSPMTTVLADFCSALP